MPLMSIDGITTELPSKQNDPEDVNVLVYILPVASILFAAVLILCILCIFKRMKKTKLKYKDSEIPRTESTVSEEYEAYREPYIEYEPYGTDYPSIDSEINENLNYVSS